LDGWVALRESDLREVEVSEELLISLCDDVLVLGGRVARLLCSEFLIEIRHVLGIPLQMHDWLFACHSKENECALTHNVRDEHRPDLLAEQFVPLPVDVLEEFLRLHFLGVPVACAQSLVGVLAQKLKFDDF